MSQTRNRRMFLKARIIFLLSLLVCFPSSIAPEDAAATEKHPPLVMEMEGRRGTQLEVGSFYAGLEIQHGSIEPNRISFYYPAANSIDLSRDYWSRGDYPVMTYSLKVGDGPAQRIGRDLYRCTFSPYSATLHRADSEKEVQVTYGFCYRRPAMGTSIEITNTSGKAQDFSLDTSLETSLKTSSSFALAGDAASSYDATGHTVYTDHKSEATQKACIFVTNAGEAPYQYSMRAGPDNRPVAAFSYKKHLRPGEKLSVVQLAGSCREGEKREMAAYLRDNYHSEMTLLEQYVQQKVYEEGKISTGHRSIDETALWAKGVLAVNRHSLDGHVVPMPCPAEYNFFFTHDTLVTDLWAVNFDTPRVKKDLLYIAGKADPGGIIPHSYYWRDDRYVTEYAGPDNWNHFWFVIVTARYLRHSGDIDTVRKLYPLLKASMEKTLLNRKDDLICAGRPDWWDIGNSFGPRAYMTTLSIRALRECAFIASSLGEDQDLAGKYEHIASAMETQLLKKLWDRDRGYLMNYFSDGSVDPHFYTGSLLAADLDTMSPEKRARLVETAEKELLDPETGIYNATPMDFHTLIGFLKFSGDEAGKPYHYMNGGIWYQGNAWYAQALIAAGRREKALDFVEHVMTLQGIKSGPNGQPAFYECRNGNSRDPENYGTVDKPQFLWAAAWYLGTVYRLFGHHESQWNIAFDPWLPKDWKEISYEISLKGRPVMVYIRGSGRHMGEIRYDNRPYPSAVIPERDPPLSRIEITMGHPEIPCLSSVNSVLEEAKYDRAAKRLELTLRAFPGHKARCRILSPCGVKSITHNDREVKESWKAEAFDGLCELTLDYVQQNTADCIVLQMR